MNHPHTAEYRHIIFALAASTRRLDAIPDALCASAWLREHDDVVFAVSPNIGSFADFMVNEDEPPAFDRETWVALSENIAWYAAYMDVLVNRRRKSVRALVGVAS
jgi:hypothetical protein